MLDQVGPEWQHVAQLPLPFPVCTACAAPSCVMTPRASSHRQAWSPLQVNNRGMKDGGLGWSVLKGGGLGWAGLASTEGGWKGMEGAGATHTIEVRVGSYSHTSRAGPALTHTVRGGLRRGAVIMEAGFTKMQEMSGNSS